MFEKSEGIIISGLTSLKRSKLSESAVMKKNMECR